MQGKASKTTEKKRWLSMRRLAVISALIVLLVVGGAVLSRFLVPVPKAEFSFKAAIVDQLGEEYENPDFNSSGPIATMLRDAGFTVSYFESAAVNVAFYRELAKGNYGFIVLRSHAALRINETLVDFFTSEEFSENRYSSEVNSGLLARGYYSWKPNKSYFTITPSFIANLESGFPKSIVVAMGCNSLNESAMEMAEAFINKGATAYVGWTGLVDPTHTDDETTKLLQAFVRENETMRQALGTLQADPYYGSHLNCFPPTIDDLTLHDVTAKSSGHMMLVVSTMNRVSVAAVLTRYSSAWGADALAPHGALLVFQTVEPSGHAHV